MDITADASSPAEPPETPEDPLALERQVCFALGVASRRVLSIYRPLLEPMGLTHPQYLVMLALWGETPLSVGKIGSLLQLDSPTLSPLLKRLEAAGLVFSGTSPSKTLMEIAELPRSVHPFYLGTQFHPEFKARPLHPHPLFTAFIKAVIGKKA